MVFFLKPFWSWFTNGFFQNFVAVDQKLPPIVHVYMFSKADDKHGDVRQVSFDEDRAIIFESQPIFHLFPIHSTYLMVH